MPRPITLVDSGGMPITEATWGEPMTPVEAPLYGEPMTLVDSGGVPVVLVNDDLSPWAHIALSTAVNGVVTVSEDVASGTSIGELSVVGGRGVYTFTVTSDPDGKVSIVNDFDVENDALFDYEVATSHTFTVEADNGVDPPLTAEFTIVVTDVTGVDDPTIPFSAMLAYNPHLAFYPALAGSCFQERTGASATTASGDGEVVGSLKNWGTLGDWHVAPSDGARPIRRQSGSLWYLDADGVDDVLRSQVAGALANVSGWTIVAGFRNDTPTTAAPNIVSIMGTSATVTRAVMGFNVTTGNAYTGGRRLDANSTITIQGGPYASTDVVLTGIGDFTNTDVFLRANGTQIASSLSWLTSGSTANDGGHSVLFGFNHTTPTAFADGRLYSLLVFPTVLSGADLALVEEWTAQQMGL